MQKEDIYVLQTMIREFGGRQTVKGLIQALQLTADEMSDLGLKERVIEIEKVLLQLETLTTAETN
jgi:hypothetical protein